MSCRYQPNYRGDADFRGVAGLRTEPCLDFTFDIEQGIYIPAPTIPVLIPMDRILSLDCDETITNISISENSAHSFYRTTNLTTNQGYLARLFTIQIDDPDNCALLLTNISGFSPYVTVHRSNALQWQGVPESNGIFKFVVDTGQTGPMIVEVSSLSKHEKGSFDIKLVCVEDINCNFDAVPDLGVSPLSVAFTNLSYSNYPIEYDWDFGDGSPHSTVENPVHVYASIGVFTATLTITNIFGTTDSSSHDINVSDDPVLVGVRLDSDSEAIIFGILGCVPGIRMFNPAAPFLLWDLGAFCTVFQVYQFALDDWRVEVSFDGVETATYQSLSGPRGTYSIIINPGGVPPTVTVI